MNFKQGFRKSLCIYDNTEKRKKKKGGAGFSKRETSEVNKE